MEPKQALFRRKAGAGPSDAAPYRELAEVDRGRTYPYLSLIGLKDMHPLKVVEKVSRGLAYTALARFQEHTLFSAQDVSEFVSIPPRTLHRRKIQGRLDPQESDRLLRVARVFAKALGLFEGDASAARNWLFMPARALGGERPIQLVHTDIGSREVEALIDRLEHGVLT